MPTDSPKPPQAASLPLLPGERAAAPEGVELNTPTAWAEFERLRDEGDAAPDAAFATTQPQGQLPSAAPRGRPAAPVTVNAVMVEARRYNRVCPKPPAWQRLHELLAAHTGQGQPPPLSLTGPVWQATSAMPKRMALRDQIEWAETRGLLPAVLDFLKALPEDQWHHMDE
ncbi:hypothetical protein [Ramlibacter rhizophilus]|uniref:Uncharacterized protein n=1 Tax=Ramlibacter rhizophilus TaxID=1781167 RepID=A0A4Z0BG85_9BURK|nr:hypothetical protein [Ramlibacter rhizophilus]TFY96908.1 hypothetical protein EZ242_19755 [Ramlibacter rhizophilus]